MEVFTREFFLPFERMLIQEDMEVNGFRTSPWMTTGNYVNFMTYPNMTCHRNISDLIT